MNLFGLIGHPLGHSFSKAYFTAKFEREGLDCEYQNFDLEDLSSLKQLVRFASFRGGTTKQPEGSSTEGRKSMLLGFNVTIPYKEAILPYLDELDPTAKEIGAVNTVKVFPDGKLMGYNTDTIGFESLLKKIANDNHHREEGATLRHCEGGTTEASIAVTSLVLGTGGASKAVQYVLKKNGIPFHLVSRDPKKGDLTYAQLTPDIIKEHLLIINTTPVGMAPHFDAAPDIPYEAITPGHILIDLIYNPEETLFLKNGREQGATTANGLTMLYAQAEASWKIWNDSSSLRGRHDRSNPSGAKPSTSPSISK